MCESVFGRCCCCCCCCCCYPPGFYGFCLPEHPHFPEGFRRRFRTKEEKIADLERYLEALKKEAQAVEEELKKLRKE